MSKPAVHSITHSDNNTGRIVSLPWIAIHAPEGAIARHHPRIRCESEVNRLVYEYRRTDPSAIGERISVNLLSCQAAIKKSADEMTVKIAANLISSSPAGKARLAVRGLAASIQIGRAHV